MHFHRVLSADERLLLWKVVCFICRNTTVMVWKPFFYFERFKYTTIPIISYYIINFYYIIAYYNSKIRQNVKNVNCCVQANKYTGTLVWLPFNSGFWCLMRILSFNCSNLKLFSCPIISKSPRFTLLKPQLWDLTCCNGGNTCMPFKLFPVRPEMCLCSSQTVFL